MAEPLSTPCHVDTPPVNKVIAHAITREEDDVRLLNNPIALFSRAYDKNNGNVLTLTQSCPENDIPQKRKAAPHSPSSTAHSMMPLPRRKRPIHPIPSSPARATILVAVSIADIVDHVHLPPPINQRCLSLSSIINVAFESPRSTTTFSRKKANLDPIRL